MKEFIEELKYNQNINFEKGLENRVDIDYVIERLEDINICDEYFKNEVEFNIENLINDECVYEEDLQKIQNLTNEDIKKIAEEISYDDYTCERLNEEIEDTIFHYIHRKEIKEETPLF